MLKPVTNGKKIRQQLGTDSLKACAVTFIFRNKSGRVKDVDDGVCLAPLRYNASAKKASIIDLFHNQKYKAPNSWNYLSVGHISIKTKAGGNKMIAWRKEYADQVMEILSRSKRWGKYFTLGHPSSILRKTRGYYFLRIDPKKVSYSWVLFMYGWYRFICESRSYGYQLILWDQYNNTLPEEEQLTVDQLIVLANRYKFNPKFPGRLIVNDDIGGGHRNFNGYLVEDCLTTYDIYKYKLSNQSKICEFAGRQGLPKGPMSVLNMHPKYEVVSTINEFKNIVRDNKK